MKSPIIVSTHCSAVASLVAALAAEHNVNIVIEEKTATSANDWFQSEVYQPKDIIDHFNKTEYYQQTLAEESLPKETQPFRKLNQRQKRKNKRRNQHI